MLLLSGTSAARLHQQIQPRGENKWHCDAADQLQLLKQNGKVDVSYRDGDGREIRYSSSIIESRKTTTTTTTRDLDFFLGHSGPPVTAATSASTAWRNRRGDAAVAILLASKIRKQVEFGIFLGHHSPLSTTRNDGSSAATVSISGAKQQRRRW